MNLICRADVCALESMLQCQNKVQRAEYSNKRGEQAS